MADPVLAEELIVATLLREPEKCERLMRKHRPLNDQCRECRVPSTFPKPCRPFRLARVAAYRMDQGHDRSR